jgi:hypothetical protein
MALELLFRVRPTVIEALELDASLSEEHTSDAEVTEHPVEVGADISDHKRKKPLQVKITGLVTNTPLKFLNFNSGDAAVTAWDLLQELQKGSALITVITTLKTYDNMAIISLSAPRDVKRGHSLEFTATMREIFTAKSGTVAAPETPASKAKELGKVPTPPAPAPQTTILLKIAAAAKAAL